MTTLDRVIKEVAERHGISVKDVTTIFNLQFKFVKTVMSSYRMKNIRLPKFGVFYINDKKKSILNYHNNEGNTDYRSGTGRES